MDLVTYKCPNCGAPIVFDSDSQKFICESCDSAFSEAELVASQQGTNQKSDEPAFDERGVLDSGVSNYVCKFCGAEIVTDSNTVATACPYCDNPVILAPQVSGMLRPDYVLPFKLNKEQAEDALKRFYNGKKLLPDAFTRNNRISEIKGVYVPFWLYDCTCESSVNFEATKESHKEDADYKYKIISHFNLWRSGKLSFRDIPVDASKNMPDSYMDAIEPFEYNDLTDFNAGYLSGFLADKFDVSDEEAAQKAAERAENSTVSAIHNSVNGYNSCSVSSKNSSFSDFKHKYCLLPVWMLSTKFEDKVYTFAMNGQTGKMVGELPVDKGKYRKWLFGVAAAVAAVGQLLVFLL